MEAAAAEAISKVTPMKPHFFKPLLPGFLNGLLIPVTFFKKYLNHHGKSKNQDMAVLRTVLGEWKVKIKDGIFEEDCWRDFANHHSLHVGEMVVFRHEGELVFDVTIFDSTACERSYDHHQPPQLLAVKQDISLQKSDDDDLQACVVGQKKRVNNNSAKTSPKEVAAASSALPAYPCFTSTLKPCNLKEYRFFIPMGFARSNGLCNRRCEMLILDDDERKSWKVRLNEKSGGVYISGNGYRDLIAENRLRAGDNISFELISQGNNPVMVLHAHTTFEGSKKPIATKTLTLSEGKEERMSLPSQASWHLKVKKETMKLTSKTSHCFMSTVSRTRDFYSLTIPTHFARLHDLTKHSQMTIRDPSYRLWPVWLRKDSSLRIRQGWKDVALANKLKPGEEIKFELDKGVKKIPLMNMSVVCGGPKSGRSGWCKEEELPAYHQEIPHAPDYITLN